MKKLTDRIPNKDCDTPNEIQLSRYLDQKLEEKEREKVQKHLIHCSKCRTLLIETTRSLKMIKESSEEKLPLKPVNNIFYYAKALTPLVASAVIFISVPILDPKENAIQYKGIEIEKNILDESMEYWEDLFEKYFGK